MKERTSIMGTLGKIAFPMMWLFVFVSAPTVFGSEVEELKEKIGEREQGITVLAEEIKKIEGDLSEIGKEKVTLESKLREIDTTRKKLSTDIQLTEIKIERTNLNLNRLLIEINIKEESIERSKAAIGESVRTMRELDDRSTLEILLGGDSFGIVMSEANTLGQLQKEVNIFLETLAADKSMLEDSLVASSLERQNLLDFTSKVEQQKSIADRQRLAQNSLLEETKGEEAGFKSLLEEKRKLFEQFQEDLLAFESQLQIAIDPLSIPSRGSRALIWPLRDVRITQYFGNTIFAQKNAAVYNGKGHNGVDLAASVGTELLSAAGGIVVGAGDTDTVCKGASYGKWVLIEHDNGLSTLYAHLSSIGVAAGQRVASADVIGYSGNTGYTTGPHLHFSVFASKGVSVGSLASKNPRCGTYTLPRAALNSYMNPLDFL